MPFLGVFEGLLLSGLERGERVDEIHVRILTEFVPEYIRYGILNKYYTRRQRPNESLVDFVEDISLMSDVFGWDSPKLNLLKLFLLGQVELRIGPSYCLPIRH